MLSNAYFLANFSFDTAENEPAKNLKKLPILLTLTPCAVRDRRVRRDRERAGLVELRLEAAGGL